MHCFPLLISKSGWPINLLYKLSTQFSHQNSTLWQLCWWRMHLKKSFKETHWQCTVFRSKEVRDPLNPPWIPPLYLFEHCSYWSYMVALQAQQNICFEFRGIWQGVIMSPLFLPPPKCWYMQGVPKVWSYNYINYNKCLNW